MASSLPPVFLTKLRLYAARICPFRLASFDLRPHHVRPPRAVWHDYGGDPLISASLVIDVARDELECYRATEVAVDYLPSVGSRISGRNPDAHNTPIIRNAED